MLTVGWMPGYLFFNATGPNKYKGKNASHFSPTAAFFEPKDYPLIVQTVSAFMVALSILVASIIKFGKQILLLLY